MSSFMGRARDYIDGVAERLRALGYQARGIAVLGTPSAMILQEAAPPIGSDSDWCFTEAIG